MLLKNKFYTVMVVPSATSKVKKVKISGRLVNAVFSLVGVLFLGSGYLAYDYVMMKGQVSELVRLRTETRTQRLKINSFAQQIIDVEKEMARLRKFDAMLRGVFDLDKGQGGAAARMGGQGGTGDLDLLQYPEVLEGNIGELSDQMDKDLSRLKGETSVQESSLGGLVEFLQEQRSLLLATPSIWPVKGMVTSGYQMRVDPFSGRVEKHLGLDIATHEGSPIMAPADGVVTYVGRQVGLGKMLGIDHGYGYTTRYGHNSRIVVAVGQRVKRGQIVSYVGNTGKSTGPHLHYEISKNGMPVDPAEFILN